jgi:hypothetical protein
MTAHCTGDLIEHVKLASYLAEWAEAHGRKIRSPNQQAEQGVADQRAAAPQLKVL